MNFVKLRLFQITKILGPLTYKLEFPERIKISHIQYIFVLESADSAVSLITDIPDIDSESQKKIWEIKKILDSGLMNNN